MSLSGIHFVSPSLSPFFFSTPPIFSFPSSFLSSLSLSLSLSLSFLLFYFSICVSLSVFIFLSLARSLFLPLPVPISLCRSHPLTLSYFLHLSLYLSLYIYIFEDLYMCIFFLNLTLLFPLSPTLITFADCLFYSTIYVSTCTDCTNSSI